jgi:intracellular multiplication protein IcmK
VKKFLGLVFTVLIVFAHKVGADSQPVGASLPMNPPPGVTVNNEESNQALPPVNAPPPNLTNVAPANNGIPNQAPSAVSTTPPSLTPVAPADGEMANPSAVNAALPASTPPLNGIANPTPVSASQLGAPQGEAAPTSEFLNRQASPTALNASMANNNSEAPAPAVTSAVPEERPASTATAPAPINAPPPVNAPPQDPTRNFSSAPPPPPSMAANPADAAQFQRWLGPNTPPPMATKVPPKPKPIKRKHVKMLTGRDAPLVQSPPLTYTESKQIMLDMAPPLPIAPHPESDIAFNNMMQQNMPLTPQQVVKLRQLIDTSQRAAAIPPTIPPKPVSTTLIVNLAPGSTPPAIRLAQGYISSLVFVDSTGAPWPIAAYDIGDPKIVNIQWDGKSNIMMMQAISPYSSGNLVIRLVGLDTPVTLELVSGQRVVDYRTDIHVPGTGPNAKELPTGTGLPNSANQLLLSVLDGVAPTGSRLLTVTGGDCQAWLLNDRMYLRTRLTVLSPGWIGKMSSPDGMMAYEMQKTSSVLVSQYGNPIELKVEGF